MEEKEINKLEEKEINVAEEEKEDIEEITKNKVSKPKKVVAVIAALAIISGAGTFTYAKSMYKKIDNLLNLHNVTMEDGFDALKDEFGEIPGWMVDLYLRLSPEYKDQDIIKIGDTYITKSGEPFENTIEGKSFSVYTDSGEEIKIENFDGKQKLINDESEKIDPISRKELREDYILEFDIEHVEKIKEDEDGKIIYEAHHGPRLEKKNLR